jgi:hypothetical protein
MALLWTNGKNISNFFQIILFVQNKNKTSDSNNTWQVLRYTKARRKHSKRAICTNKEDKSVFNHSIT